MRAVPNRYVVERDPECAANHRYQKDHFDPASVGGDAC